MVVSSVTGLVRNDSILSTLNYDELYLKSECLPILIGTQKYQHLRAPNMNSNSHRIDTYLRNNKKCPEIVIYWSQAVKPLSGARHLISRASTTFEGSRPIDRFWIIHTELFPLEPSQPNNEWKSINIFNERSYLSILNSVIPILICCVTIEDVPQILTPLISSTLAAEHISNLAVNLPSLCVVLLEVLQTHMRVSLEPSELWKCSRTLLSIASKDRNLAVIVRNSLVRKKEHPLLCLEITTRFIYDSDLFIDQHLCPRITSTPSSISSSWMAAGLRNTDLLAISRLTGDRLKVLISGRMEAKRGFSSPKGGKGQKEQKGSPVLEARQQWENDVIRCARIIAVCASIHSTNNTNRISSSSSSSDSYAKIDVIVITASAMIQITENILRDMVDMDTNRINPIALEEEEYHAEFINRIAIKLLLVGLSIASSAFSHVRTDYVRTDSVRTDSVQNIALRTQLLSRESKLLHAMEMAIEVRNQLSMKVGTRSTNNTNNTNNDCTNNCAAIESARSCRLFHLLAVTFESNSALRSICAELSLNHCVDFMVENDLTRVITVLSKLIPRINNRDHYFRLEFDALVQPEIISATREWTGDWLSCLSLMLSCDLMSAYDGEKWDAAIGPDKSTADDTHSLMVRVLSKVKWPLHTRLKNCVDEWLVRCIGVHRSEPIAGNNRYSMPFGLPLLFNEVCTLCEPLLSHLPQLSQLSQLSTITITFSITSDKSSSKSSILCGVCLRRKRKESEKSMEFGSSSSGNRVGRRDMSDGILVLLNDSVRQYLQLWGGLEGNEDELDKVGDDDDTLSDVPCSCDPLSSFPSSSIDSACTIEGHDSCEDSGISGVIACYAALHYGSLSMSREEGGSGNKQVSELIYMGPFVCDFRSLPIKASIEFLLHRLRAMPSSQPSHSAGSSVIHSTIAQAATLLNRFIDLATELCADILLPERSRCYRPTYGSIYGSSVCVSPCGSSAGISERGLVGLKVPMGVLDVRGVLGVKSAEGNEGNEADDLCNIISELIAPQEGKEEREDGVDQTGIPSQHMVCCALLSSFFPIAGVSKINLPSVQPTTLMRRHIMKAAENKQDTQLSASLWAIWRTYHTRHPYPQLLEISTINTLLSVRNLDFHPKVFSSYEMLLQEPLLLFSLPYPILSELFVLRLVLFSTRSALCASRCAVRLALKVKHRVAESFLSAGLRHRSLTESSLYLRAQTYIDLQEVMAVRLTLALWEMWADEESAGDIRLILNDFLAVLISDNSRLISLLLCHQLSPRSFELLISCDPTVAIALSTCHLQELQNISTALTTLPTITALNIDPSISSSSILFATTASAAANLSTDSEISPDDVERLLLHSLCILKLTRGHGSEKIIKHNTGEREKDKEKEKHKPIKDQLADALPLFLISATNSLNSNLNSKEMSPILQHCTAIVTELYSHYPSCVLALGEIVKYPERKMTANTAAIALAVKGLTGRGHVISKDEEAVMIRARPAVVALVKIISNVEKHERMHERIHSIIVPAEGAGSYQFNAPAAVAASAAAAVGTAISGKTHRSIDDSNAALEDYAAKKKLKPSSQYPE